MPRRPAGEKIPVSASIFEKPSASAGVHSPAASPYTPFEAAISECGELTPSTNTEPGRNSTCTSPVTRACEDSEQRLDVAAYRVEVLPLVHQIAIRLRDGFLDARLLAGQHQLLELAMRGQQHLRRRRLESDPPLGADDGVAQVDAAADAERARRASPAAR